MSIPLTKIDSLSPERYPDVIRAGGLSARISEALAALGSPLRVSPFDDAPIAYARVEKPPRFSQIYIASTERLFLPDFWSQGVCLAHLATADVDEAVRAIHVWIVDAPNGAEFASQLTHVRMSPAAAAFENGTAVESAWQRYLTGPPTNHRGLVEFIRAAYEAPQLRQLFPFKSLNRFCFSRCTGYPYTDDCPIVAPTLDGRLVVYTRRGESLIESGSPSPAVDVVEAVRLAIEALPPGTGPARPGTAEDQPEGTPPEEET